MSCSLLSLFGTKIKRKSHSRRTITIEIHSATQQVWRAAILSVDASSTYNIISQSLVTKVLGDPIHPIDKETARPTEGGNTQLAEGYIDLDWCLENNSKKIHRTRFFVSAAYDPPYDAVLGKDDGLQHGLVKKRSKNRT